MTKKLMNKVTLIAQIEERQHEALRTLAYKERKSIAAVVREALDLYFAEKKMDGAAKLKESP